MPVPTKGPFTKNQVAEDTELQMRGRPQKFGAAMPDEPPTDSGAGLAPTVPPPSAAPAPGADMMPATPPEQQPVTLESLAAENQSLMQRVDMLEKKLGITNEPDDLEFDESETGFGQEG